MGNGAGTLRALCCLPRHRVPTATRPPRASRRLQRPDPKEDGVAEEARGAGRATGHLQAGQGAREVGAVVREVYEECQGKGVQ